MTETGFFKHKMQYPIIVLLIVAIVAITLLTVFLPRERTFSLQFDLGKPWKYSSLIADCDFPIYKSDKELAAEKDSILKTLVPYFIVDIDKGNAITSQVANMIEDSVPDINEVVLEILSRKIKDIYESGVIETEQLAKAQCDSNSLIRLIIDNHAIETKVADILSPAEAYEKLMDENPRYRLIMQKSNVSDFLVGNVMYDVNKNAANIEDISEDLSVADGVVLKGQKIIDRGEIVNQETYNILVSYEKEMNRDLDSDKALGIFYGQILFIILMVSLLVGYLLLFRKDYVENVKSMLMLMMLLVIYPIFCYLCVRYKWLNVYVIPFAICPIFIRLFMDSRTAFFFHFIVIILCACSLRYPYEFIVIQSIAAAVTIASLRDLSSRFQLIKSAFLITLVVCVTYFAIELMQDGDIKNLEVRTYINLCFNGILLLFAYPLMWCVEKTFGLTSNVTLVELSNTNNNLLRHLSEVAPGTFQHSIQVGNLAAEVAARIKAKPQLCRTGALYHDIGKIENPAFFIENQSGQNPHDSLSPIDSAHIVISHVTEGIKLAEKHNIPQLVTDFIRTHHGQGKCGYFFAAYKKEHIEEAIDPLPFTYPGPMPFTREQAIVMMADTCEAASRALTEYTERSISELVNKLIDSQLEAGYFQDCPITFRDITIAKSVLAEKLKIIYHTRIQYPN